MDNIKTSTCLPKIKKELETLIQAVRIYREDKEVEFGRKKMCHIDNEKQKTNGI